MVRPTVQIGTDAQNQPLTWDFSTHLAVQGQTRSGKSSLVYAILAQAATQRNVQVAGIDVSGILLSPIAEARPSWRPLLHTGGLDLDRAAGVLGGVVAEMDRRVAALVRARRDKLSDFAPDQPLLLVAVEEAPGLVQALHDDDALAGRKPKDRLAPRVQRSLRRILAEGAKVGVICLTIAQRMSVEVLPGDGRSNFGVRVTLRMNDPDGAKMLHPGLPDEELAFLSVAKPGVGIVDDASGRRHLRTRALSYAHFLDSLDPS